MIVFKKGKIEGSSEIVANGEQKCEPGSQAKKF
jgi:hypothetical protein